MIILGVDPGTLITGLGVIETKNGTNSLLAYDIVKNNSKQSMPIRLKHIYQQICALIERYHPDEFAIETAFYGKNAQSALKIGHARGVSILAAVNHEIPTTEYSPREAKKAVTGNGAASKQQVQYMVKSCLQLKETPKYFDATDALAVALCHAFRTGSTSKAQHSKKRLKHTKSGSWSAFVKTHPERIARNT
jgi:crossover junction endodeoxyribonuclease RuvC